MKRIYVGNLAWRATALDLRAWFEDRGFKTVDGAVPRDAGRSRGYGFVELDSDEAATAARTRLDGMDLMGRPVKLAEARERAPVAA